MAVVSNPAVVTEAAGEVDAELLDKVLAILRKLEAYLERTGKRADWHKVRMILDEVADLIHRAIGVPPRFAQVSPIGETVARLLEDKYGPPPA